MLILLYWWQSFKGLLRSEYSSRSFTFLLDFRNLLLWSLLFQLNLVLSLRRWIFFWECSLCLYDNFLNIVLIFFGKGLWIIHIIRVFSESVIWRTPILFIQARVIIYEHTIHKSAWIRTFSNLISLYLYFYLFFSNLWLH